MPLPDEQDRAYGVAPEQSPCASQVRARTSLVTRFPLTHGPGADRLPEAHVPFFYRSDRRAPQADHQHLGGDSPVEARTSRPVTDLLSLQRLAGNAAVQRLAGEADRVDTLVRSGGAPLDPGVRADMQQRFGADFGDVRVHTGSEADRSARALGAHAYTVGSHVVFQRDAYETGSAAGRRTLAHELTHVLQQRSGAVDGSAVAPGLSVSSPDDRFERAAAATADRVMANPGPAASGGAPVGDSSAGAPRSSGQVQRQAAEAEQEPEEDTAEP